MNNAPTTQFNTAPSKSHGSSLQRNLPLVDTASSVVIKNDLLAALPANQLAPLLPHLEFVYLPAERQLFEVDQRLTHVHFPTTAVVALMYLLSNGSTMEIAVVGNDGILGISALMGEAALGTAIVQSPGYAYKLSVERLKEACSRCEKLQRELRCYTQRLFQQIAYNSVCCRHFSIDQQLCRWLLNRLDRLPTNVLKMTQAMIASMLGVRRESITGAASRLQQEGLIRYRRGSITVLNRVGLEQFAGECYQPPTQQSNLIVPQGALR